MVAYQMVAFHFLGHNIIQYIVHIVTGLSQCYDMLFM